MQGKTQEQLAAREAALNRLHQRIRACRLCQQHGYIPQAHPLVSGRATDAIWSSDRLRAIVLWRRTDHSADPAGASCKNGWNRQASRPATCTTTAISLHSPTATPAKTRAAMVTAVPPRPK